MADPSDNKIFLKKFRIFLILDLRIENKMLYFGMIRKLLDIGEKK